MLRLDLLHPVISGNKWYKLKYNIEEAIRENKKTLLSFGGAYSNHLHAMAYAGKQFGLKTIGIIRGEAVINETLTDCKEWGMDLHFISRSQYKNKTEENFWSEIQTSFPGAYLIPEGGNNDLGIKGCKEILQTIDIAKYDIITCAVGTAATYTGLIEASLSSQSLLGFLAIKSGEYLRHEIENKTSKRNWDLITDFHFGGFAKKNLALLSFMEDFKTTQSIPLDFIYNGKMMYGLFEMIAQGSTFDSKKILVVHTGGLQGNRSLI